MSGIKLILFAAWTAVVMLALGVTAHAQVYPAKPIRLVVPLGPGSPPDVTARLLGQRMAAGLAQPVVVENRSGAGGTIGGQAVAKASADGYTLLMGSSSSLAIGPLLFASAGYVPTQAFAPISLVAQQPFIIAIPVTLNANTIAEFAAVVKANPGKFNYASPQNGSPPHMSGALMLQSLGLDMVHVPFGGIPKAAQAMVAGEAHLFIETAPAFVALARAGKIRMLAVAAAERTPFLPEVPTTAEAGLPGFEVGSWSGLVAPAGTPGAIVARLNREVHEAVKASDVQEGFARQMTEIRTGTPEAFASRIAAESAKWAKLIALAGVKPE